MGVHGLWQLLQPAGRPVSLESLEGKVLAVDVSIWLHQTMKGMRDKDGNPLPNAHLQGLFSRVCKLLYYRIKPVFVFDGGVPVLKKQTLAARRERKSEAERESSEIAQKLLKNLVKSQVVKQALGSQGEMSAPTRVPGVHKGRNQQDQDLFKLAPLPESEEIGLMMNAEQWERDFEQQENWIKEGLATLSEVEPDSEEFQVLPMEIQHEILSEMREKKKYHSLSRLTKLPEDSDSFSNYQLKKLMKQCKLTTRIETVRKNMSSKTAGDVTSSLGEEYYGEDVEARRIVSEDASHYVLIKGLTKQKQLTEAEKYDIHTKVKLEKIEEEEDNKDSAGVQSAVNGSRQVTRGMGGSRSRGGGSRKAWSGSGRRNVSLAPPSKKKAAGNEEKNKLQVLLHASSASTVEDDDDVEVEEREKDGEVCVMDSEDLASDSNSEDEGFIEVMFDPRKVVEDELFPASVFTQSAEDGAAVLPPPPPPPPSDSNPYHPKNISPPTKPQVKNESGEEDECLSVAAENRKKGDEGPPKTLSNETRRQNVLTDVLKQLQKKKEELNMDSEKVGLDLEKSVPEVTARDSESNSCSVGEEKDNPLSYDKETAGGFLVEEEEEEIGHTEAPSMEDFVKLSEVDSEEVEGGRAENVNYEKLPDSLSDDEDGDLKLAIELSLKSAEAETQLHHEMKALDSFTDKELYKDAANKHFQNKDKDTRGDEGEEMAMFYEDSDSDAEDDGTRSDNNPSSILPKQKEPIKPGALQEEDDSTEQVHDTVRTGEISDEEEGRKMKRNSSLPSVTASEVIGENRMQPEDLDDDTDSFYPALTEEDMMDLQTELGSERTALLSEQGKQSRMATSITDQVNLEAQELLRLFGIPYVVSPMEAEAQCAFLDLSSQTQGTITDDSDIWLFGGQRVYKNFFNQNKHVEFFSVDGVHSHLALAREQLIQIALLCGSDYTPGIQGVGPVRALEIMAEFPGNGLEGLTAFRKWWDKAKKQTSWMSESRIRAKLRDLKIISGFPSQVVVDAYLNPEIDDSEERFTWGDPDLDMLRDFAKLKFGWSRERSDQALVPMWKQLTKKQAQARIHAYFQPESFIPASKISSERLKKALAALTNPQQEVQTEAIAAAEDEKVKAEKRKVKGGKKKEEKQCEDTEMVDESGNGKAIQRGRSMKGAVTAKEVVDVSVTSSGVKRKSNLTAAKAKKASRKSDSRKEKTVETPEQVCKEEGEEEKGEAMMGAEMGNKACPGQGEGACHLTKADQVKQVSTTLVKKAPSQTSGRGRQMNKPVLSLDQNSGRGRGRQSRRKAPQGSVREGALCLSESSSSSESDGGASNEGGADVEDWEVIQAVSGNEPKRWKREASVPHGKARELKTSTFPDVGIGKKKNSALLPNRLGDEESLPSPSRKHSEVPGRRKQTGEIVKGQKEPNRENTLPPNSKSSSKGIGSAQVVSDSCEVASLDEVRVGKTHKMNSKTSNSNSSRFVESVHDVSTSWTSVSNRGKVVENTWPDSLSGQLTSALGSEDKKIDIRKADVSIINKQNLPSTLAYLNKRSREEKYILHQLKGRPAIMNAVEQRMEDEERRARMEALEKERRKRSLVLETSEPQKSFEDLLGGMDTHTVVKAKEKKKLGASKLESTASGGRGSRDQSSVVKKEGAEERGNQKPRQPWGISERKEIGTTKPGAELEGKKDSSLKANTNNRELKRNKEKVREDETVKKKHSIQMGGKGSKEELAEHETEEKKRKLVETESRDAAHVEKSVRKEKTEKSADSLKSKRSYAFDQPIRGFEDDGDNWLPENPRFRQQIQHLGDARVVKGHGIVPSTTGQSVLTLATTKGRAYAGKGKGRGKNRNRGGEEEVKKAVGMESGWRVSSQVTEAEVMEYAHVTADDLGSDFSDLD